MNILSDYVREATASIVEINLGGQPLTGATRDFSKRGAPWENIDSQMDGFVALCSVLDKVQKISLADCHLGPASAAELGKAISDANASINSLTIDSTNDMDNKTYTLAAHMDRIDLTSLSLGQEDVSLIANWFTAIDFSTELKSIQYDGALMSHDGNSLLHLLRMLLCTQPRPKLSQQHV